MATYNCAVSVCTVKAIKLNTRKKAAYVYFFLAASFATVSGLRLAIRDCLLKVEGRRPITGKSSYPGLPLSSSDL
jgi:hypothetical protein